PSNDSGSDSEWDAFERETNLHIKTLHAVLSVYSPLPLYWLIYTGSDTKLHVAELGLFALLDPKMLFHSAAPVTVTPDVVIGGANTTWLGTFLHDTNDAIYAYYQDASGVISYSLIKTTTQTTVTPPLVTTRPGNIPNLQGIAPAY